MEEWLAFAAKNAAMVIEAMALLVIVIGTIVVFIKGVPAMLRPSTTDKEVRHVWLRYARWLVAGLTFQLAADIIKTTIAPTWEDIGQVAATAVIRTFLEFCLMRDLTEVPVRLRAHDASQPRR
jgi:uncharacterized membrane protein